MPIEESDNKDFILVFTQEIVLSGDILLVVKSKSKIFKNQYLFYVSFHTSFYSSGQ